MKFFSQFIPSVYLLSHDFSMSEFFFMFSKREKISSSLHSDISWWCRSIAGCVCILKMKQPGEKKIDVGTFSISFVCEMAHFMPSHCSAIEFCNCYHKRLLFLLSIWIWMIELNFLWHKNLMQKLWVNKVRQFKLFHASWA